MINNRSVFDVYCHLQDCVTIHLTIYSSITKCFGVYPTVNSLVIKLCMLCILHYLYFNNKIVSIVHLTTYNSMSKLCVVYHTVYSLVTKLCIYSSITKLYVVHFMIYISIRKLCVLSILWDIVLTKLCL